MTDVHIGKYGDRSPDILKLLEACSSSSKKKKKILHEEALETWGDGQPTL